MEGLAVHYPGGIMKGLAVHYPGGIMKDSLFIILITRVFTKEIKNLKEQHI